MKILSLAALALSAVNADWNYEKENQKVWWVDYPMCSHQTNKDDDYYINRQSPVNIVTNVKKNPEKNIYRGNKYLPNLHFQDGTDAVAEQVTMTNNGKYITIDGFDNSNILLPGGLVLDKYALDHIEIKWPSEHKLGGDASAVEFQMYFDRVSGGSGLGTDMVAISTLYKKGNKNKAETVVTLLDSLDSIVSAGSSVNFALAFTDILSSKSLKKYYIYEGLTTVPPCDTSVTWIVGANRKSMSDSQYKGFKKLLDINGEDDMKARRKTQKMGARVVYNSFDDGEEEESILDLLNGGGKDTAGGDDEMSQLASLFG